MAVLSDAGALLQLLHFASPAFPTGGFAYSHGLEMAVEVSDVGDGPSLAAWLHDVLHHGAGRTDLILLRHAHDSISEPERLASVAQFASAIAGGRERQEETMAQGAAFAASLRSWCIVENAAYPVVFGAAAAHIGIDAELACLGFLSSWTGNLISAAVRLGVCGQAGGLAVLASLEAVMLDVAAQTRGAPLDACGGCCALADVASMRHETLYSRLFRS